METKYYWFTEGSGLLTEREKKQWINWYRLTDGDFTLSDVAITDTQTEFEAISAWFQHKDQNGSYMEIAKDLRDTREYCPHDDDFIRNLDALVVVLCGWIQDAYETEWKMNPVYMSILTRLTDLRRKYSND